MRKGSNWCVGYRGDGLRGLEHEREPADRCWEWEYGSELLVLRVWFFVSEPVKFLTSSVRIICTTGQNRG